MATAAVVTRQAPSCEPADDVAGAADLTTELVLGGHRDIWFIGDVELPWYRRCAQGYTQAAWWNRIPNAAWLLMMTIATASNVLLGYGARRTARFPLMLFVLHWPFRPAYITVSWLCWVPNLLVAEWMVRRRG